MFRTFLLVASVVCAIVLIGCSKTETGNNSNSTANTEKSTGSAPSTGASSTTASTSGDKIGVPECDDFIAKYEACTNKVPEMVRAQYKEALTRWRTEWRKLANDPNTKGQLASACKQAADAQATAWKMYGCGN